MFVFWQTDNKLKRVAGGKNPGRRGFAGRLRNGDMIALQIQTPLGDRPQLHRQSKKRQQRIGRKIARLAFERGDRHRR